MKIDVYDIWAQRPDNSRLHFDVLVPNGMDPGKVEQYARQWLAGIGSADSLIEIHQLNYCHSETANPAIQQQIEDRQFAIHQMEGCP